ncbi:uncharacterized protein RAG0_15107 [Rhynchosporium agropyri]|uniref:Carboxyphosphonoenolpyruvate phosphonomutase-like protein n=1 Tax=Rhynchosporium agropyri TaxID=914238 RepID=A0A1E1LJM3_9HELO|nr:uncharacterized protein RAG0_15107 [Rhynchosporium agropyri]
MRTRAAATASYAKAAKLNLADEDLSLPQNLSSVSQFSSTIRDAGLPLSIGLQDGYGDQISEAITGAILIGAVGCNIEDSYPEKGFGDGMACLRSVEEAADRIRKVLDIAREKGVPDFVVNARTDVMCLKPNPEGLTREMMVEEAVKRGKAYLLAGATSIFVWEIGVGILPAEEIKILVDAFQGRLAVKLGVGKTIYQSRSWLIWVFAGSVLGQACWKLARMAFAEALFGFNRVASFGFKIFSHVGLTPNPTRTFTILGGSHHA